MKGEGAIRTSYETGRKLVPAQFFRQRVMRDRRAIACTFYERASNFIYIFRNGKTQHAALPRVQLIHRIDARNAAARTKILYLALCVSTSHSINIAAQARHNGMRIV